MCKNVTFHGITVLEVKAGMRFFRDLDDAPKSEPPLGAPFHDTDGWGSFPGPSLDDEHEEESREEYAAMKACDFHIPDLEVPPMRAQAATAGAQVRSTSDPIAQGCGLYLPHELALELRDFMYSALHAYDPCRNSSDYVCRFCGEHEHGGDHA